MSNFILDFWNSQAKKFGVSHEASWGDNFAIQLEIETVGKHIPAGANVLDVGCANGYSMLHHLDKAGKLTGVDFSADMIAQAVEIQKTLERQSDIKFEVGDVRKLRFEDAAFDVVYTTRTLINLPTWNEQKQGVAECIRVCKPGGKIVFSEAFWEPLVLLNAIRQLRALEPLVEHDFNRYLKKARLEELLGSLKLKYTVDDFSSVYYLGSRFLRELVTNPADYAGYSNPINKIFYEIETQFSGGGFGIQQAYIVEK